MKNSPGRIILKSVAIVSALTLGGGLIAYRQLSAQRDDTPTPAEKPQAGTTTERNETPDQFAGRIGNPFEHSITHLSSSKSAPAIRSEDIDPLSVLKLWETKPTAQTSPGTSTYLSGSKAPVGVITAPDAKRLFDAKDESGPSEFSIYAVRPDTVIILKKSPGVPEEKLARFAVRITGETSHELLPSRTRGVSRDEIDAMITPELLSKIRQRLRATATLVNYHIQETGAPSATKRQFTATYQLPSSKRSGDIFQFEADADGHIYLIGSDRYPSEGYIAAIRAYINGHPAPKGTEQPAVSAK